MRLETIHIDRLKRESGVGFGTSGVRGLVSAMTDKACYAYTLAFLQHLIDSRAIALESPVAIAGDLRASSSRIMVAVSRAVVDSGCRPIHCGSIPTPAVACFGISKGIPSIMVTGSHIPDDRNGIKFYKPTGEILKQDEQTICNTLVQWPSSLFDNTGQFAQSYALGPVDPSARQMYLDRYIGFFPENALHGLQVGVYEHSSVARDILKEILVSLGAHVHSLGRSETFIPVDTEAIRDEDIRLASQWAEERHLDCIVSTDGDGDRPLISDERGHWLRGDVAGILCAKALQAEHVVTPISSNTAVEKCGWFTSVRRTRIGSPFVIEAMNDLAGLGSTVGFEANGGFLTATDIERNGRLLSALPTRDAIIVILSILYLGIERKCKVSALTQKLPARFSASGRLKHFPTDISKLQLQELEQAAKLGKQENIESMFQGIIPSIACIDMTDGVRLTAPSGEIVHIRPSGNAPELRCYTEADSQDRAENLLDQMLALLENWRA